MKSIVCHAVTTGHLCISEVTLGASHEREGP